MSNNLGRLLVRAIFGNLARLWVYISGMSYILALNSGFLESWNRLS
uniref:Uncharacterized protein n=1 Tax=Anguilla anguilla TaxID=7936 RepID=A0A0E9S9N2_ANGAN